ncbi:GrpE-domain-containing protein [Kockiozyma suomiensis]|uniref:GrpE-domain-containing protein n=1 Tax=Kockiozyma suomiensis TaxID=1337062 RepID=UPI003343E5CA
MLPARISARILRSAGASRVRMAPSLMRSGAYSAPASMFAMRMYSDANTKTEEASSTTATQEENPASSPATSPEEKRIAELEAQVAAKSKEAAEFKDRLLRQVAEFRNLQETTKREIQSAKDFAISKFARDLLDSVDNLDRALATVPESSQQASKEAEEATDRELIALFDGVKMTQQVLEQTLRRHGLTKIDPLGERFDPHQHEATFEIEQPDKEPGTVFFVQQAGFMLNNRVLRAAKVGVVKSPN